MTDSASPLASQAAVRRTDRWPPTAWLVAGLAIGAVTWVGIAATVPTGPELLPTVNRWLVRAGFPFFCLAFAAGPLASVHRSALTTRLLRERRGLGLAWAMIHLIHAAAILTMFDADAESVPPVFVIAFGGVGFALTAAMAATSSDAAQRALGRGWGRLHRTGLWYLMFIYVYSYLGRVLTAPTPWFVAALVLLLGLVGLRAGVWLRRRKAS